MPLLRGEAFAALDHWDRRYLAVPNRIGEWQSECPSCRRRCLLLREIGDPVLFDDPDQTEMQAVCGLGCQERHVLAGLRLWLPEPKPRQPRRIPSFSDRDALDDLSAVEYVPALTGEELRFGFVRCPFHDGDDTGSLKAYDGDRGWHCFGCHRGGTIIDFGAELYGLTPRGSGYFEIRRMLGEALRIPVAA